ncbi:MAG: archaemetzincin family Zn-dependent metalloprotease [Thermoproteota archaeon]
MKIPIFMFPHQVLNNHPIDINVAPSLKNTFSKANVTEILLVPIGNINPSELSFLPAELSKIFRTINFEVERSILKLPSHTYDKARKQYNSTLLLEYLAMVKSRGYGKYLGIVNVDLYARGLNFVFGEAVLNGEDAIISLHRLRPEFYGDPPDSEVFKTRIVKEAVHELGHTFGLTHCENRECVMHFSNSIIDTDLKKAQPCLKCHVKLFRKLFQEVD